MKYLDRTLGTAQENLACDEALLDQCEEGGCDEILRFWEPQQHFAVLGYSNKARTEADLDSCRTLGIPVLRRCSGGGTVLQGPGCLNYALILQIREGSALENIIEANAFIMNRNRNALNSLVGGPVLIQGHTDLTLQGLKFSGNSQRRRKRFLLFHGTFLLNFNLALVSELMPIPSKQPDYRDNRSHGNFLTNLNMSAVRIKAALQSTWDAAGSLKNPPVNEIAILAQEKYSTAQWNQKF